jgi:hypothetical protein
MTLPRPVRYRCELQSQLELDSTGELVQARVVEISETGGFVEEVPGLLDVQPGESATIAVPLPGGEPWVARITFLRNGLGRLELRNPRVENLTLQVRGYGVTFDKMGAADRDRLLDFLDLLDSR